MTANPNVLGTIYKTTAEHFDGAVVFTNWLASADTVASATVTAWNGSTNVSSTLINTVSTTTTTVTFELLAAGTAGTTYKLLVTATTAASDVWQGIIYLAVN